MVTLKKGAGSANASIRLGLSPSITRMGRSFNIVTTLTLLVLEKKREISIMKAMGARHGQVAAVFLAEGILIGGIGVGGGIFFGFILCMLLRRYEFIKLPDIYYDRTLPVTFDATYYLLVATCAVLIVLAACLYPSRRAARLQAS